MRVLISGASGLLGTTLAPFLNRCGYDIVRHGYHSDSDVICDLTNKTATHAMLKAVDPEVVINLVANTDVDKCEVGPQKAYLLNVKTVENIVGGMSIYCPKTFFIHISTDQIYDSLGPSYEDDINLTNTYALTKYAGELAAKLIPSTVLRTNFFGNSLLPGRNSFSDWVIENLRNGNPMTGFTDIVINPLSMKTLSAMVGHAIERKIEGVFNLGSRGSISKADFIFEIAKTYGLESTNVGRGLSTNAPCLAYRPKDMQMNCGKFECAFNVQLPYIKTEIHQLNEADCAIT